MTESSTIRWDRGEDGIVILTLDDPNQSANTMNAAYLESMAATIDLATAQREMAGDWISAYKKYFHTDKPLFMDSATPTKRSESEVVAGKST